MNPQLKTDSAKLVGAAICESLYVLMDRTYTTHHSQSHAPQQALAENKNLLIAMARIEEARALYRIERVRLFPSISLTGQFGTETAEFSDLLDSDGKYWILEIDLLMPLFNAGARRAELSAAEARFNQSRLAYEQSVPEALGGGWEPESVPSKAE